MFLFSVITVSPAHHYADTVPKHQSTTVLPRLPGCQVSNHHNVAIDAPHRWIILALDVFVRSNDDRKHHSEDDREDQNFYQQVEHDSDRADRLGLLRVELLDCPCNVDDGQCEVDTIDFVFRQSKGAVMSQKAQKRISKQKRVEVVWAGPAVVREQKTERRVPIGHRGPGMRKELFADSDGSSNGSGSEVEGGRSRTKNRARQRSTIINSSGYTSSAIQHQFVVKRKMAAAKVQSVREVQVVDESVDQLHRMQSLRKIQLWLWSQQVRHRMDAIKICFRKWVSEGLAGGFIRKYARRDRQFCRSVSVYDLVQSSFDAREFGSDPIPLTEADQAELKSGGGLYPFPNKRLQVPVGDRSFVGVAAVRMTAATVLRMVLLRKAVDAAQSSDYVRLTHAFRGWYWWGQQEGADRLNYYTAVLDEFWYPVWWKRTFYPMWERWTFAAVVRRVERMVCRLDAERVRGATRQWLSNLCEWGQMQLRKQQKAAKVKEAAEAAGAAAEAARTTADAVRTAACATMVEAVAKATAVTRADRAMQVQWGYMAGQLEEIQQYY